MAEHNCQATNGTVHRPLNKRAITATGPKNPQRALEPTRLHTEYLFAELGSEQAAGIFRRLAVGIGGEGGCCWACVEAGFSRLWRFFVPASGRGFPQSAALLGCRMHITNGYMQDFAKANMPQPGKHPLTALTWLCLAHKVAVVCTCS